MPDEAMRRHGRVLIVPPTDDEVTQAGSEYLAWCAVDWVPAEARPDLDPITNVAADSARAREMSSPMAMFGIPISARGYTPRADTSADGDQSLDEEDPSFGGVSDSYGAQVDVDPLVLSIGDLVELEPGYWVTVDEEPEEDPMDPTSVLLCWRDDEDTTPEPWA